MPKALSDEAAHVLSAMNAYGKLLRIARDGSGARLVDPPRWWRWRPSRRAGFKSYGQIPIPSRVVFELQHSGALAKLGQGWTDQRAGLDQMGIRDGDKAEYWCCRG